MRRFALLCLLLLSSSAFADDWASVRITARGSGYDVDKSGFASFGHLGLSLRAPEVIEGVSARAELSALVRSDSEGGASVEDNSSYLHFAWKPGTWSEGEGLEVTVLPLSARRLYLGSEPEVGLGWDSATLCLGTRPVRPGLEVRLAKNRWYGALGAKVATCVEPMKARAEPFWTGLAKAGVDLLSLLELELGGTYVEGGQIGGGEGTFLAAFSGHARYHRGAPIGPSVEFVRYERDPAMWEELFVPEVYPGGLSLSVSLDAIYALRRLPASDGSGAVGRSGGAYALEARAKLDAWRFHLRGVLQSVEFLQAERYAITAIDPAEANMTRRAGLLATMGFDRHFESLGLTPGLALSIELPASCDVPWSLGGNNPPPGLSASREIVYQREGGGHVLPAGAGRKTIYGGSATLKWNLANRLLALAEVDLAYDRNRHPLEYSGLPEPVAADRTVVGVHAAVQARF